MNLFERIDELIKIGKSSGEISSEIKIPRRKLKSVCSVEQWRLIVENTRRFTNQNLVKSRKLVDISKHPVDEIIIEIRNGFGCSEISKKYDVSKDVILRIAKAFDIKSILKQNNFNYIAKRGHEIAVEKYKEQLNLAYEEHHEIIREMIESGKHLSLIKIQTKLPKRTIKDIIEILDLTDALKINSQKVIRENRIKNSLIGADIVRGSKIIRHEVTNEMKEFYCQCISDNLFEGDSRSQFFSKFGTAGRNTWNALIEEFGQIKKHPPYFLPGSDNKMFGKEPDWKAGNGIKGHIFIKNKLIYFRSSLELRIYCYLDFNDIDFELSKHVVKYFYKEKTRNYFQDIVIGDCIFEIKPTIKLNWEINRVKFEALQKYCQKYNLSCEYLTESTFDLSSIDINFINEKIEQKVIIINDKEYNRLLKYCKKW